MYNYVSLSLSLSLYLSLSIYIYMYVYTSYIHTHLCHTRLRQSCACFYKRVPAPAHLLRVRICDVVLAQATKEFTIGCDGRSCLQQ